MVLCRYSLLCLYGNARSILHKRHQYPSRHQWHRVRSSSVYLWLHHRLQPAGAQWCVVCFLLHCQHYTTTSVLDMDAFVELLCHTGTQQFYWLLALVFRHCVIDKCGHFTVCTEIPYKVQNAEYVPSDICCFFCVPGDYRDDHVFSLYFMIPFFFTTLALFYHNW